jgi:hypothetical protein
VNEAQSSTQIRYFLIKKACAWSINRLLRNSETMTQEITSKPPRNGNAHTSSSILSTISRGKRPRHIFALLYGTDGVGKSTMCSQAPNPIFIGAEKGTEQLDVARFPQTDSIGELLNQIWALQTGKHDFNTVVLDSLDWVEPLMWKAVCEEGKVETIEQYALRQRLCPGA